MFVADNVTDYYAYSLKMSEGRRVVTTNLTREVPVDILKYSIRDD